jgi:alpha-D-ribose 1-methylphosphonate 5-triphosphate synthase subunit PhnL
MSDLDQFCQLLLDDDALRATLDLDDEAAVIDAVIEAARARGLALTGEMIRAEISRHQRSWFERWM